MKTLDENGKHPIEKVEYELVDAVGLESLGYPPTWVDTKQEADQVEAAVIEFLERKNEC